MAKFPRSLFSNPKYDYENIPVSWAVRISDNGEFIHSAPWSVRDQGVARMIEQGRYCADVLNQIRTRTRPRISIYGLRT